MAKSRYSTKQLLTSAVFIGALTLGVVGAQTPPQQALITVPPPAVPADEAAKITSGWLLLAQSKYREAADYGDALLRDYPRNPAVLALAIESTIAGRGAYASLTVYQQWLGTRTFEEPGALRRIARAYLFEWARQTLDVTARVEALKVLATDGVPEAAAALNQGAAADRRTELWALATIGNVSAIDRLLAQIQAPAGRGASATDKVNAIRILGETRSPRVVRPLIGLLTDQDSEIRSRAAEALGSAGQREAIGPLKPLLTDPVGHVQIASAGALLKLGDASGINIIRDLLRNEGSAFRRTAAALLAPVPDEEWKALVRGLASDPDAATRLDAAKWLAPYDEPFSKSLFESLLSDPNPEIQEQVGVIMAQSMATPDLPALRRLMRAAAGRVRVAAAARLVTALR